MTTSGRKLDLVSFQDTASCFVAPAAPGAIQAPQRSLQETKSNFLPRLSQDPTTLKNLEHEILDIPITVSHSLYNRDFVVNAFRNCPKGGSFYLEQLKCHKPG